MEKADAIAVILIGLLILSIIYALYGVGYEAYQISVIKESVAQTENIPESGYFNITVTLTEYQGRQVIFPKPVMYKYKYATDKGINLEFRSPYKIGTKITLLGYTNSKGINILSQEAIT